MAMVSADGSSQSFGGLTAQIGWFGQRVGGQPALSLHSSNELGELSQWLCHDDSTINIVVVIIIIIILFHATYELSLHNFVRPDSDHELNNLESSSVCVTLVPVVEPTMPLFWSTASRNWPITSGTLWIRFTSSWAWRYSFFRFFCSSLM